MTAESFTSAILGFCTTISPNVNDVPSDTNSN